MPLTIKRADILAATIWDILSKEDYIEGLLAIEMVAGFLLAVSETALPDSNGENDAYDNELEEFCGDVLFYRDLSLQEGGAKETIAETPWDKPNVED